MPKTILAYLLLSVLWTISCDSNDDELQKREEDDGNMAGDWSNCEIVSRDVTGWEEVTDIGAPKDLFARNAGSCEAVFKWNGSGWNGGNLTITPATGEGNISVTVEIDKQSAQLVTQVPGDDAYGDVQCNKYLSIDALVTIELLGGKLATQKKVTLAAFPEDYDGLFSLSFDEKELSAWLDTIDEISILFEDDVDGGMSMIIMPIETACVGDAYLQYVMSMGDGTGSAAQGQFGNWSDTGCGVGEEPVDLSETSSESGSVLEQIELIWGVNSYAGKWDDGVATVLDMNVSTVATDVCRADNQIRVPAQIQYGTRDDLLQQHTTEGNLSLSINTNGSIRTSQIRFSDDRICDDEQDSIGYGLSTCVKLESITIQLGITRGSNGLEGVSDEGLMIYEYDRDSSASPGSADRLRIFEFDL